MAIEKIRGIVLNSIKHNDKNNIVSLFTETRGRVSFISPVGSGKSGKIRNARLLPLSVVESDVNFRPNDNLQYLGTISPVYIWHDIYFNPMKSAITYFLADFLNKYFKEASQDKVAWRFIVTAIEKFDSMDCSLANFHLWFLIRFLDFAGITPDLSNYKKGDFLDMRAGLPSPVPPVHEDRLMPAEMETVALLQRMNLSNFHKFRFSVSERRRILELLLKYYSIHYPGLGNLKSLEILSELFT